MAIGDLAGLGPFLCLKELAETSCEPSIKHHSRSPTAVKTSHSLNKLGSQRGNLWPLLYLRTSNGGCSLQDSVSQHPTFNEHLTMSVKAQCWACRKGRLVCDATRPACKKCTKRGTVCPGYAAKPLTWVEPGEVRSKKKGTKSYNQKWRKEDEEDAPANKAGDEQLSSAESSSSTPPATHTVSGELYLPGCISTHLDPSLTVSAQMRAIISAVEYCKLGHASWCPWLEQHTVSAMDNTANHFQSMQTTPSSVRI